MTLHGGSVFRVTDLGPEFTTPMHRTRSIDYCIVLSGEVELVLDGGETVQLEAGETVVQRGTSHAWRNPSRDAPWSA
jgi:quercetin dioxygenase-like cupin family protein